MKIAISIPSHGEWPMEFGTALIDLISYTNSQLDCSVYVNCSASSIILQNRYDLVMRAKVEGCTHLLWLDDDMIFPKETLVRLLGHNKPIVACNYVSRKFPVVPHAARDDQRIYSEGKTGLEEADHVGLGACLTDIAVFRAEDEPWFYFGWHPKSKQFIGEDVWFFRKAKAAGFQLYIDHDLSKEIGHLGHCEFTHEMAVRG